MWCLVCREYPKSWVDGDPHLRLSTVKDHTKCGLCAKCVALWPSGGASWFIVGALPSGVQSTIQGLFFTMYRIVKRDGNLMDVARDAELVHRTGGSITPSYTGRMSIVTILHEIVALHRAYEGAASLQSQFFGLASDSCIDRCGSDTRIFACASPVQFFFAQPVTCHHGCDRCVMQWGLA